MTYFPGLSDSGLPHHWDMETSLDITSPTIIMDFDSGEGNSLGRSPNSLSSNSVM